MSGHKITPRQMDFFHTHGFLVLRQLLAEGEAQALRAEIMETLRAGYEFPESPSDGTTGVGYYLPMMGPKTPHSRALGNDSRLFAVAEQLLGGPVLPKPAKGVFHRDSTVWHPDAVAPSLKALKVVTYLDPLDTATGALQVLPGSHVPEAGKRLAEYRRRSRRSGPGIDLAGEAAAWPGFGLDSEPGDVIFFDIKLWHAALGGHERVQWTMSFTAMPADAAERTAVRDYIMQFLHEDHPYDPEVHPYFDPAWEAEGRPAFADVLLELHTED